MSNDLDELCRGYRSMLTAQQQLALRITCCTRRAEYSQIMRERLVELRQHQHQLLVGQRAAASAIRRHTDALPDERLRTIVELRYLGGMSWAQVSELMGLELRWVMRLHRRALNINKSPVKIP